MTEFRLAVVALFAFGFVHLVGIPAHAQEIPRYDPEAHCKKVASFGGTYSEMLNASCLDMEQTSYDKLKLAWSSIGGKMRQHCDKVARFGGAGSYHLLESCIDMEMQAQKKATSKGFKF